MISNIKTLLSKMDLAYLLLLGMLIKILSSPSLNFPESMAFLGLLAYTGARFYFQEVILKPQQEDIKKELQELKSRFGRLESEIRQSQAQVKPPTQRIWG
jgi:hypothetical protein